MKIRVGYSSLTFIHLVNSNPGTVYAASKVKLNKSSINLRYGRYTFLKLKGTSKRGKWSSTNKSVATVTSKGKVTAAGHGNAIIKVKINKKHKTLRCKVAVPYTFANDSLRKEHFMKHGVVMGYKSALAYEKAAANVITNKASLHKTESEDGDDVYYLEDTNQLVIVSTYGFIRTFFSPAGGKDYFERT